MADIWIFVVMQLIPTLVIGAVGMLLAIFPVEQIRSGRVAVILLISALAYSIGAVMRLK